MNVHRPRAKHHRRSLAPPYSTAKGVLRGRRRASRLSGSGLQVCNTASGRRLSRGDGAAWEERSMTALRQGWAAMGPTP